MTAKEIAEEHATGINEYRVYMFTPEELQGYANALCKEQRELCAEEAEVEHHWRDGEAYIDKDWILNAPQPEEK